MNQKYSVLVHRFAVTTSVATLILLCAGALVTGTGSGLAVPDWPLSYGQFFPPMVGGVLFEHGHRLIAGSVAILMVIFCGVLIKKEKRAWVRRLGIAGVIAVFTQAGLGGLTVLLRLPKEVSIAHACLAQIFFSITVTLSLVTSRAWMDASEITADEAPDEFIPLRYLSLLTSITFFAQLVAGATVRHFKAGLAIPDFPTVFGGVLPPVFSFPVAIHFAHRLGAFTLIFLVAVLATKVLRKYSNQMGLTALVGVLSMLVAFQFMLGASVIWLKRPIPVTTIHLAVGAMCLATSIALTVYSFRIRWRLQQTLSLQKSFPMGMEPA